MRTFLQFSSRGLKPELLLLAQPCSPLPCTGFAQPRSEQADSRGVREGGSKSCSCLTSGLLRLQKTSFALCILPKLEAAACFLVRCFPNVISQDGSVMFFLTDRS